MLVRINNKGVVDGVVLTADQNQAKLVNLADHQTISLNFDVIPSKQSSYDSPITYSQNGTVHYYYEQVLGQDGKPVLDSKGNPIKKVKTQKVTQYVSLLDDMNLFTIEDIIQKKYQLLAQRNYFQYVYAKQFYINTPKGPYTSGIIDTNQTNIDLVVVHAIGSFKTIEISNDGGNTFTPASNDSVTKFQTGGNGLLSIKFDITPLEFGIMY